MKPYLKVIACLLFVICSVVLANASTFATELSEPQKIIADSSNQLKARLQDPGFNRDFLQLYQFVHSVVYPHIDFDLISSLVLGKNWKDASPTEKENFKKEFQTLLIRVYSRELAEFSEWSIDYLPMNQEKDGRKALVKTQIHQPGIQPVSVDYRVLKTDGGWKIYDIISDGVSLVTNYRTGFKNEVERTGSLEQVIAALAKRNGEALASNNPNINPQEKCLTC